MTDFYEDSKTSNYIVQNIFATHYFWKKIYHVRYKYLNEYYLQFRNK